MKMGEKSLSQLGLVLFAFLIACTSCVSAASNESAASEEKCVAKGDGCSEAKDGLILSCWRPFKTSTADYVARGFVYFFALCYMFLGVSIVSDRFMSAIEMITSQEKQVTVTRPNGEKAVVTVQIWNETVSNLTLMALGSSAPEIMLSVIEIISRKFESGDLGPGTIVGSAAFNLFCIIAICVYVIPDGEGRRIEHLRVFVCTASWSVFAYIWMYIIIAVISPNEVEVWEGLVTFAFFPLLVLIAYITDRKIFFMRFLDKKYTAHYTGAQDINMSEQNGDVEMQKHNANNNHDGNLLSNHDAHVGFKGSKMNLQDLSSSDQHKREFMMKLVELKEQHPDLDMDKLEQMAAYEVVQNQHKSRAYYRIAATRKMTGGGNVIKKNLEKKAHEKDLTEVIEEEESFAKVVFDPEHYTVMENVGSFEVGVYRIGEDLDFYTYVDFETIDGSANQGSDFHYAAGTLVFKPDETHKEVTLHIVDDDVFEEDEHFSVKLSNVRNAKSPLADKVQNDPSIDCRLGAVDECMITILDDDHCGVFCFEEEEISCPENCGEVKIKIARHSGARGNIHVPFLTIDGTAKGGGVDFEDSFGELEFTNDQASGFITVKVIDDEEYEKHEHFFVEIGNPRQIARRSSTGTVIYEDDFEKDESKMTEEELIATQGRAKLGAITRLKVNITESKEFTGAVDRLLKNTNMGELLSTSSWTEQFVEAISVSAGGDDDDEGDDEEGGENSLPSCMDYVMHFLTVFWKILFAFIPPTNIAGGWACFVVSIGGIGALTAVIGDLASHFGCTVGLKDAVTAISFVALGTSVPDTFASKTAAVGDKTADASIGNVTGSNAVNVFLGIGIAWSVAAIYHAIKGTPGGFAVEPGALGFSVTLFCILASICIAALFFRRFNSSIGFELGGPRKSKIITSILFVGLWITYVAMSAMVAYCVFDPGF
ncbi:sodium/calcium exchanger 1-like [Symsagittifera roscoffensis]|uniref:sodium/calcium exchanger 1-like n=1 Tax=Symsagittifera roscoffensis TaxID=84072 RepID=UPI00307C092D